MLFDILWKLARKSLSQSLYNWLSYYVFRRRIQYEKLETYSSIFNHYRQKRLEFNGKTVVEAGCGLQIFTALYMLRAGAKRVLLAEPKVLEKQRALDQIDFFQEKTSQKFEALEAAERIEFHRGLDEIGDSHSGQIDLICSFTVLEHISELETFFRDSHRLLKPGGISYHMVDVSDHTYQFFARFPVLRRLNENRALYHLRYSKKTFRLLNDPKCFMNRVLLPQYLELASAHGFIVDEIDAVPYEGPCIVNPEILHSLKPFDPKLLHTNAFSLKLRKP